MNVGRLCAGTLVGALIGFLAWGEGRAPVLACLLPLVVATSSSRGQAFAIGFGYAASTLRYAPSFIGSWFDGSLSVGLAALVVYGAVSGAVWSLAWTSAHAGHWRILAMLAAWLLALLPPAAPGIAGHPLIATGYLAPGSGWLGVVASVAVPALAVWCFAVFDWSRRLQIRTLAAIGVVLASMGVAIGPIPALDSVNGVYGMRTSLGELRGRDDAIERIEFMGRVGRPSDDAVTIVWPESLLGRYDTSMYPVLNLELLRPARASGFVHIVGMDLPLPGERLLNSAVAFYPDGRTATATARQPAPVSLWKPWRSEQTFVANWRAHNMLTLGQGDRAAVIFCYEEYLPILYLLNEAFDAPTLYLAMANTWAAAHADAATIQTAHSMGMARLFGRPYVKAENRPSAPSALPIDRPAFTTLRQLP